jgi:hypothetical protein
MRLDTVESDVIHAIGYDPEIRLLEVIFNDGSIYQYREVPQEVYEGLMSAESKGQYFQQNVRDEFQYWKFDRGAATIVRATSDNPEVTD